MLEAEKEKVIGSGRSSKDYWKEIWEARELFWILAKRDVIVRYKQTILGVAWSIIRPLITAMVMGFAFGKLAKLEVDTPIPYILVVMPGVIIWLFFSQSLQQLSLSMVLNSNLVTKVYFPRLIIPFSTILLGLIDMAIAMLLFIGLCFWFHFVPDWKIVFVPLFIVLCYLSVFGVGLMAAVLNVKYRDIGQIVPFIIQFGYFISPVAYITDLAAGKWYYYLFILNPVTGVIDAMRWAMLGDFAKFNWNSFIPMLVFILLTFFVSIRFFRKHENSFVDHI